MFQFHALNPDLYIQDKKINQKYAKSRNKILVKYFYLFLRRNIGIYLFI